MLSGLTPRLALFIGPLSDCLIEATVPLTVPWDYLATSTIGPVSFEMLFGWDISSTWLEYGSSRDASPSLIGGVFMVSSSFSIFPFRLIQALLSRSSTLFRPFLGPVLSALFGFCMPYSKPVLYRYWVMEDPSPYYEILIVCSVSLC